MVSIKKGNKERSGGVHRDRRARVTLGDKWAAIFARDKVLLLGCLPLCPPSLVRQRSMILGGLCNYSA